MSRKLTGKQKDFAQAYCTPGKGYNNATQAAIIAGYSAKTANSVVTRLLANAGIKQAIARLKADLVAESQFTREKQLKDLESAKSLAQGQNNASAMVSAIREQNEMLGYHRENAPNAEREAAKRAAMTKEEKELSKAVAKVRTAQEADERPRIAKLEAG